MNAAVGGAGTPPVSKEVIRISLARAACLADEWARPVPRRSHRPVPGLVVMREGERPPLVLAHPVGGSVMPYIPLVNALVGGTAIYGLENQVRRGQPSEPASTIEAMAARSVEVLATVHPSGPCWVAGYSMGGMVVFEIARLLERDGRGPASVIIIDSASQVQRGPDDPIDVPNAADLVMAGRLIADRSGRRIGMTVDDLDGRPWDEQLGLLVDDLRDAGVVPAAMDRSTMAAVVDVVRSNVAAQRAYRPGRFAGRVEVIRAAGPSPELAAECGELYGDPSFGWQRWCERPCGLHRVAGGHLQLLDVPYVRGVAHRIRAIIATQASGAGRSEVARGGG